MSANFLQVRVLGFVLRLLWANVKFLADQTNDMSYNGEIENPIAGLSSVQSGFRITHDATKENMFFHNRLGIEL